MTLDAKSRLGPYEIVAPLGAGGMGEVYRARDARLGREVAVKVLPLEVAADRERLKRFEKEARSASALNHPNIVTIYETGTSDGLPWIAMEHVEGETLRTLVTNGPLQVKKLLNVAIQIAEGLARAHEAGIVHRDLKPENVMVTKDGLVKILDFGLAKLQGPVSGGSDKESQLPTVTGTSPGIVLGTVGYMSPEQAAGKLVDFRSDQFAFGSILYEMATGKRAFQKKTAVETLSAILNEEPEAIASINSQVPAPLRWTIDRCLSKEPENRYASTKDLARDLANVRDRLAEISRSSSVVLPVTRFPLRRAALGVLGTIVVLGAAYLLATLRRLPAPQPHFQKVTFQRGSIWSARFARDGQTIVYTMASWDYLRGPQVFVTTVGSLDSRSLGLPPADVLSISRDGRLAISLAEEPWAYGMGTLAEASLSGGTPRPILENVTTADWSPDGKALAVVRRAGEKYRLEYPLGKVLQESVGLCCPRISPDGGKVAFEEWSGPTGAIRVIDSRGGAPRTLVKDFGGAPSGAWSPGGDEIWWRKVPHHDLLGLVQTTEVHAVGMNGHERIVATLLGDFNLQDLSRDGRLLVERVDQNYEMVATLPGQIERSLTWLDQSIPADLSPDGRVLLFSDRGDAAGVGNSAVYLRKTDGSPAVRLGAGLALALSPDGKWALAARGNTSFQLVLLPTGAGQERAVPTGAVEVGLQWGAFHPNGKHIFFVGAESGLRWRAYELSLEGGPPTPVTPEGMLPILISQDGALLFARGDGERDAKIYPTNPNSETSPRTVALLSKNDQPVHWSADGRSLLIADDAFRPIRVDRLDLSSGRRSLWRTISPGALMGTAGLKNMVMSANEDTWVAGYARGLSELLVIDGLK
jgi:serine/threonine protein kinase/Tol biopolymer transport system component